MKKQIFFALMLFCVGSSLTASCPMEKMACKVEIAEKYSINSVSEIRIESGWDMLTDVCSVTMPKKMAWKNKPVTNDDTYALTDPTYRLFKKGDPIKVYIGYGSPSSLLFDGYITKINAKSPITLECQDAMWHLKQSPFSLSPDYGSIKLKELLTYCQEAVSDKFKFEFDCVNLNLGKIRIKDSTPAKLLDHLRHNYGLFSFFKNGKLYVGLNTVPALQKTHIVKFNTHVPIGSNNLSYNSKEDTQIKVKAISMDDDNKKTEVIAGSDDGEIRTIYRYNVPESDLKKIAEAEAERLRYDGYRGTLGIIGKPVVNHGDIVDLRDNIYPERNGKYFIKKVTTSFSTSGIRQSLELDARL